MRILQPNRLPADRALLKVFPQPISIWDKFGKADRFDRPSFEKSERASERAKEGGRLPAPAHNRCRPGLARRAHLSGGGSQSRDSGRAAARGGEERGFPRDRNSRPGSPAPAGRSGASGEQAGGAASPRQLTYPPRGRRWPGRRRAEPGLGGPCWGGWRGAGRRWTARPGGCGALLESPPPLPL